MKFTCPICDESFSIKLKQKPVPAEKVCEETPAEPDKLGQIVVLENNYHFKQVFPLYAGNNVIGRYMKGNDIDCPIETGDLKIDLTHCIINAGKAKDGSPKYAIEDAKSNHGTFVGSERLSAREKRQIMPGTLITIGESTLMLQSLD